MASAGLSSSLAPQKVFASVSGSSLDSLQLSPDGKRLALLFSSPSKDSEAASAAHSRLLPGVAVYDFEADETLVLGATFVAYFISMYFAAACFPQLAF